MPSATSSPRPTRRAGTARSNALTRRSSANGPTASAPSTAAPATAYRHTGSPTTTSADPTQPSTANPHQPRSQPPQAGPLAECEEEASVPRLADQTPPRRPRQKSRRGDRAPASLLSLDANQQRWQVMYAADAVALSPKDDILACPLCPFRRASDKTSIPATGLDSMGH